jgi:hypothetical protein
VKIKMEKRNNNNNSVDELNDDVNQKISSDIFKNGLLLSYSIGFWDGRVRQTEQDVVVVQKAKSSPSIYEKGTKLLLPPRSVKPFYGYRTRLFNFLSIHSFGVPGLRGSRFVPKSVYPKIKEFLNREIQNFNEDVNVFIEKYPEYKEEQIKIFKEKYPEFNASDELKYPSESSIRQKFYYVWMPYAWDYTNIEKIEREARDVLEERARAMIHDASVSMRQEIFVELNSVIRTIQNSKNKINIRTISRLEQRIKDIKNINIFGDEKLDELLDRTSAVAGSIKSWTKDDINKEGFDVEVKRLAKDVAKSIVKTIDNPELEISFFRGCAPITSGEGQEGDDVLETNRRSTRAIEL